MKVNNIFVKAVGISVIAFSLSYAFYKMSGDMPFVQHANSVKEIIVGRLAQIESMGGDFYVGVKN